MQMMFSSPVPGRYDSHGSDKAGVTTPNPQSLSALRLTVSYMRRMVSSPVTQSVNLHVRWMWTACELIGVAS